LATRVRLTKYHFEEKGIMLTITENATAIVEIDREVSEANARIKELKERRAAVEAVLIEQMAEEGVPYTAVAGRRISLRKSTHYSLEGGQSSIAGEESEAVISIMGSDEAKHLVKTTIDRRSLTAFVKAYEPNEDGNSSIPDWLSKHLQVFEKTEITNRKA
jgi:hypothetical protein